MDTSTSEMIRLACTEEVPEGEGREFKIGKRYIAIFRSEGQFYALDDTCPHAGAPLNNGPVQAGTVACLWHGWRFNLRDGVCVNLPKAPAVTTFPVTIQGEDLYVTLPSGWS